MRYLRHATCWGRQAIVQKKKKNGLQTILVHRVGKMPRSLHVKEPCCGIFDRSRSFGFATGELNMFFSLMLLMKGYSLKQVYSILKFANIDIFGFTSLPTSSTATILQKSGTEPFRCNLLPVAVRFVLFVFSVYFSVLLRCTVLLFVCCTFGVPGVVVSNDFSTVLFFVCV